MTAKTCSIDGCEAIARGRGWCNKHWTRWRKHGDPLTVKRMGIDYGVSQRTVCTVHGCDRPEWSKGYCTMHYTRAAKHGDPLKVGRGGRPLKGERPSWSAVHKRIERRFGRASEMTCVDCSGRAAEWSYDGSDPDELTGPCGPGMSVLRYSLDLTRYEPRCVPCHRRFDAANRKVAP